MSGRRPRTSRWRAGVLLGVLVAAAGCGSAPGPDGTGATPTPSRTIRYLPLGDSITDGYGVPGGYRTALWQQLVGTDHDRIDFVGSLSGGPPGLGDQDHEGHSGWCISGTCRGAGTAVLPRVDGWLEQYRPDIVSIHLGTNDLATGADAPTTAARLDELLDTIYTARPDTYVVVVQIIPMRNEPTAQAAYDALVPQVADAHRARGRRIAVADLSHALAFPDDYRDSVHPTQAGFDTMGRALAPAIQTAYASLV